MLGPGFPRFQNWPWRHESLPSQRAVAQLHQFGHLIDSLGCFAKHFIEKICYKMVLRQPTSRQQVGTLYEMTSPSSL